VGCGSFLFYFIPKVTPEGVLDAEDSEIFTVHSYFLSRPPSIFTKDVSSS
jgi:hypothetical protein